MRAIVNFELQMHPPADHADDRRLLELCAQWQMARAQQEINWAEQNLDSMCRSLPSGRTQPSTEPFAKMCELQDTLACLGEPQTILGACELLGIAIKMLTYQIESPERTVVQGSLVQLVRNVSEALKWLDGRMRLSPPDWANTPLPGPEVRDDRARATDVRFALDWPRPTAGVTDRRTQSTGSTSC